MNRKTKQEPAVSILAANPYSLAVIIGNLPIFISRGKSFELGNNSFANRSEIAFGDVKTNFLAFNRLTQAADEVGNLLALGFKLGEFDNDTGDKIRAVVKEVVVFKCGVTACFDSKRCDFA